MLAKRAAQAEAEKKKQDEGCVFKARAFHKELVGGKRELTLVHA